MRSAFSATDGACTDGNGRFCNVERIESGVGTGTELRIGREFRKRFSERGLRGKARRKSPLVYVIQIMLGDISHAYDGLENVEVTGVYDEATCDGVKLFSITTA